MYRQQQATVLLSASITLITVVLVGPQLMLSVQLIHFAKIKQLPLVHVKMPAQM